MYSPEGYICFIEYAKWSGRKISICTARETWSDYNYPESILGAKRFIKIENGLGKYAKIEMDIKRDTKWPEDEDASFHLIYLT